MRSSESRSPHRSLHNCGCRARAKDQLTEPEKQVAKLRALWIEKRAHAFARFVGALLGNADPGAIKPRAAVMTVNALQLIFMRALGTNQLGHSVGSFPGLFVFVDAAGNGLAVVSLTAGDFSPVTTDVAGASFFAASLYALLR